MKFTLNILQLPSVCKPMLPQLIVTGWKESESTRLNLPRLTAPHIHLATPTACGMGDWITKHQS
jgi:hypothetical protein